MSGGRGEWWLGKKEGIRKRWGFCGKFFFFSFCVYFVCVHPCLAKHSAALTHFGNFRRRTSLHVCPIITCYKILHVHVVTVTGSPSHIH